MENRVHKALIRLADRPILLWTLQALDRVEEIEEVVVAVHPNDMKAVFHLVGRWKGHGRSAKMKIVLGGKTRGESVRNGLKALAPHLRWVVVHDGARPLVPPALIRQTLSSAHRHGAAIAAIPSVPTVKQVRGGWVVSTLDRRSIWMVQTPQAFRRDWLEEAYKKAERQKIEATDDAHLVERLGLRVRVVCGSFKNIKITTKEDLIMAEALIRHAGRAGI